MAIPSLCAACVLSWVCAQASAAQERRKRRTAVLEGGDEDEGDDEEDKDGDYDEAGSEVDEDEDGDEEKLEVAGDARGEGGPLGGGAGGSGGRRVPFALPPATARGTTGAARRAHGGLFAPSPGDAAAAVEAAHVARLKCGKKGGGGGGSGAGGPGNNPLGGQDGQSARDRKRKKAPRRKTGKTAGKLLPADIAALLGAAHVHFLQVRLLLSVTSCGGAARRGAAAPHSHATLYRERMLASSTTPAPYPYCCNLVAPQAKVGQAHMGSFA